MINASNLTTIYVSQKNGNDDWAGFFEEVRDDSQLSLHTLQAHLST